MNIMTKQSQADALRSELAQFYGSERLYRHPLNRNVVYTEGVQFFADSAGSGAYWLLDILATQPQILAEACSFAVVTLDVNDAATALLHVTDGDKGDGPVTVYERKLDFTDCPPGKWTFFFENLTIMLPGER